MILISYTSSSYYLNMEDMLHECCEKFDVPHVRYTQDWFRKTEYYQQHREIADIPRMAGLAIWKPYIILDALKLDDLVCYVDASVVFEEDPKPFINSVKCFCSGDTGTSWRHDAWTRRDTFYYMDCDSPEYWYSYTVWAGMIVARRSAIGFIEEWQKLCEDFRVIDTEGPNFCGLPNFPAFVQGRNEQGILSLLTVKHPEVATKALSPFHDYSGNWSEWVPWEVKGRSR